MIRLWLIYVIFSLRVVLWCTSTSMTPTLRLRASLRSSNPSRRVLKCEQSQSEAVVWNSRVSSVKRLSSYSVRTFLWPNSAMPTISLTLNSLKEWPRKLSLTSRSSTKSSLSLLNRKLMQEVERNLSKRRQGAAAGISARRTWITGNL